MSKYTRDQRESRWSLGIDIFCPVSSGLGLDIHQISRSRWVSVSTSQKFLSLDESRSRHPRNFSVSMSLGLDIQEISQSRWVSVSTSKKFLSLDESRSRHPTYIPVSMSLGLDIHKLSKYSWVIKPKKAAKQSESLDGVSVSTSFAQSRHWDSDFSSLGLGLAIETQIFQSRSRSRQWDSDIFSLGLGLVIET